MVIEAKRLMIEGKWCKEYVDAGMARFVDATYAAAENVALMIGYVQQSNSDGLRERVNRYVAAHPLMGAPHKLNDQPKHGNARWLHSLHQRHTRGPINLRHLWIILPESPGLPGSG